MRVQIMDVGRGMKPEEIQRIGAYMQFERRIHEQQGAGLGLELARRLTQLFQGHFRIESEPGVGTLVEVRIPLVSMG
ncbi:MAG: ATP-binding protein [Anaerolineae bacterium]|nr:ATP-binding protein [Anaerolineae bacterium]